MALQGSNASFTVDHLLHQGVFLLTRDLCQKLISANLVITDKISFVAAQAVETWACLLLALARCALQVF